MRGLARLLPILDYCNLLSYGSPTYMLKRNKKVQDTSASLIFQYRQQNLNFTRSHVSALAAH